MTTGRDTGRLAAYVRAQRESRGLTQEQFADAVGISRITAIRLEGGGEATPATLRKIADYLQVPFRDILVVEYGDDDAELPPPLPREMEQMVDLYNAMGDTDRRELLDLLDKVNEWGRYRLSTAADARARRRRPAS